MALKRPEHDGSSLSQRMSVSAGSFKSPTPTSLPLSTQQQSTISNYFRSQTSSKGKGPADEDQASERRPSNTENCAANKTTLAHSTPATVPRQARPASHKMSPKQAGNGDAGQHKQAHAAKLAMMADPTKDHGQSPSRISAWGMPVRGASVSRIAEAGAATILANAKGNRSAAESAQECSKRAKQCPDSGAQLMMLSLMQRVLQLKTEQKASSVDTEQWKSLQAACQELCRQNNCDVVEWEKLVQQTAALSGGAGEAASMLQLQSSAWAQSTERTKVAHDAMAAEMLIVQQQLGDALRSKTASLSQRSADDPGLLSQSPVWFASAEERAASPFASQAPHAACATGMRLRPDEGLGCAPGCAGCTVRSADPSVCLDKQHAVRAEEVCLCGWVRGWCCTVIVVRDMCALRDVTCRAASCCRLSDCLSHTLADFTVVSSGGARRFCSGRVPAVSAPLAGCGR